jgi:cobaltochelatase CobS
MSKGKIKKPRDPNIPDSVFKKSNEDIIYYVVQTCEVDVEDDKWQNADEALKEKLTKADEKLKEGISTVEAKIKEIDKRLGDNQGSVSDDIKSIKAEIENLKVRRPLELVVKTANLKAIDLGTQHCQLPVLISILSTKLNVYLVGPAGAGKTHAAIQCAKALNVPFHFTGAVASEFKLTGFMDAQGRIVSTEFRKAYENGGLFLFDEIDASYPQAVLAFNAALANNYMDFPDKRIERHPNFYCIAAANTYGQGADRQYIGRNQLDAASLDRFVFIDWKYDENLERELAGNEKWSSHVQKVRKFVEENKIRHVVSPRASIFGAQLLAHGIEMEVVKATVLWKGIDEATKVKIIEGIKPKQDVISKLQGDFTPKISVNVKVKKGDVLGEVYNYDFGYNERTKKVLAPCDGTVLSIANRDAISEGDLIAVIRT